MAASFFRFRCAVFNSFFSCLGLNCKVKTRATVWWLRHPPRPKNALKHVPNVRMLSSVRSWDSTMTKKCMGTHTWHNQARQEKNARNTVRWTPCWTAGAWAGCDEELHHIVHGHTWHDEVQYVEHGEYSTWNAMLGSRTLSRLWQRIDWVTQPWTQFQNPNTLFWHPLEEPQQSSW